MLLALGATIADPASAVGLQRNAEQIMAQVAGADLADDQQVVVLDANNQLDEYQDGEMVSFVSESDLAKNVDITLEGKQKVMYDSDGTAVIIDHNEDGCCDSSDEEDDKKSQDAQISQVDSNTQLSETGTGLVQTKAILAQINASLAQDGEEQQTSLESEEATADTTTKTTNDDDVVESSQTPEYETQNQQTGGQVEITDEKNEEGSEQKQSSQQEVDQNSAGNNGDSGASNDDQSTTGAGQQQPESSGTELKEPVVEAELEEEPLFSQQMKDSEALGLTHWMLYADKSTVYAYDIVNGKQKTTEVLTILDKIDNLAIDSNHGYVFVGYLSSEDDETAKIDRYDFSVDDKDKKHPLLSVNVTSALNVYEGEVISALAIDDDQSVLYISDRESKRIDSVQYDKKTLDTKGTPKGGLVETLYENVHNLEYVTALAVDYLGNLLWSIDQNGTTDGAIMRARADDPNPESAKAISRTVDAAYALCYHHEDLFFAGKDQDAIDQQEEQAQLDEEDEDEDEDAQTETEESQVDQEENEQSKLDNNNEEEQADQDSQEPAEEEAEVQGQQEEEELNEEEEEDDEVVPAEEVSDSEEEDAQVEEGGEVVADEAQQTNTDSTDGIETGENTTEEVTDIVEDDDDETNTTEEEQTEAAANEGDETENSETTSTASSTEQQSQEEVTDADETTNGDTTESEIEPSSSDSNKQQVITAAQTKSTTILPSAAAVATKAPLENNLAQTTKSSSEAEAGDERTAIYYKKLPKTGEIIKEVDIIANGFSEIVSIGSFGNYIYVADSELGFYAIEHLPDGDFSEPRPMQLTQNDEDEEAAKPKPTTMVVFTLGGVALWMNATAVLAAILGLMALM